jgi:hypothetical protein
LRKKVLIIAYYFPPMGGSGVQRPVKFAKYLQRFGWDPIVVAPDPDIYHTFDDSLLQELNDSSIRVERVQNSPLSGPARRVSIHRPVNRGKHLF